MRVVRIALLRGINVGTSKRVAMADLRAWFEGLGYENARTVLQSGNVVFEAPRAEPGTEDETRRLQEAFLKKFGFSSRFVTLSAAEFRSIIAENPWPDTETPSRLLVSVWYAPTLRAKLTPLAARDWGEDQLFLGSRAAYQQCVSGFLESPLAAAVQKALGEDVTARNWATMRKVEAAMSQ